jgi:Sec-independent protein secretion pathway component TatC
LSNLLEDPASIVDLLATSLPAQSTFFMQMVSDHGPEELISFKLPSYNLPLVSLFPFQAVVMTVTTSAIEGLRVVPLVLAFVRRFVGPRLTEKERRTAYMGLAPLNEPPDFPHADYLSSMVLYFTICE